MMVDVEGEVILVVALVVAWILRYKHCKLHNIISSLNYTVYRLHNTECKLHNNEYRIHSTEYRLLYRLL